MQLEHVDAYFLKIPFNVVFRHASAERDSTASLWLEARDTAGRTGLGESCPRAYVTGEDLAGAAGFIGSQLDGVKAAVHDIESLRAWVDGHVQDIDRNPAAWCAFELALLDLLAREQGRPIEALLGLPPLHGPFRYTAVLGDADVGTFSEQLERYRRAGFSQFKVKLSGRYEHDRERLALFSGECAEDHDVRLDANNLWQDWRIAADYLQRLPGSFAGIEEPLAAGDGAGMASLFRETGVPVILDESLLCAGQVAGLAEGIGWRINLRVSKLGGLLRALGVLEAARDRGIPVIIGAQVGETSLLTRAALALATAAGDLLAGQEGAFGTHLLSREICRPVLMFGPGGRLANEQVEELAGMPGYGLVRAGNTGELLSKEP